MFKYPLEKLIYFLATLLPGFTALLIYDLAHPGCFNWFFNISFPGYRGKLALVVFVSFVVGYTITVIMSSLLGGIGGVIGGLTPYVHPPSLAVAPWRDPKWRYALKRYLGPDAPEDTTLITQESFNSQEEMIKKYYPDHDQATQIAKLGVDRWASELNDGRWADWYDQIDRTLKEQMPVEWATQVREGLDINFEAAALCVFLSAIWIPATRHWWCFLPASLWILLLVVRSWSDIYNVSNKWATLSKQIHYLLEQEPISHQNSLFPPAS